MDDDGIVEDDNEDFLDEENVRLNRLPTNQNPAFFNTGLNLVTSFLQSYGWLVVVVAVLLFYFRDKIQELLRSRSQSRNETLDLHRYDDSEVQSRHEAMEEARRKMQEKYAQDAERFKEEQIKREEEKRKERLQDWDRHQEGKGYRSKQRNIAEPCTQQQPEVKPTSQPKKRIYKPDDYNPLTGTSSGNNYRPPQRRGGGG